MTGRTVRVVHVPTIADSLMFIRGQAGYLGPHGFQLEAIAAPTPYASVFASSEGVPVHPLAMTREITPLADLRVLAQLVRMLRRLRPDIVHAHTPKGGLLGMLAAALTGTPVRVYHMRGLPLEAAQGVKRLLLSASERVSCALAHRVICVSHSMRDRAVALRLCPAGKITVLAGGSGNGVDSTGRFSAAIAASGAGSEARRSAGIPADALVVGFVGRQTRDKGMLELAEAWQRIRAAEPRARLLLVGGEDAHDPLPQAVRDMLVGDDRVHIAGVRFDIAPWYAAMDLLVLPTYREGFPNALLEAAAMGLPSVATRVTGCVDAIEDGVTGTLVPVRDPAALGSAVMAYLSDAALRRRHGTAARARVEKDFRQEAIWAALLAEYQALLARLHPNTTS